MLHEAVKNRNALCLFFAVPVRLELTSSERQSERITPTLWDHFKKNELHNFRIYCLDTLNLVCNSCHHFWPLWRHFSTKFKAYLRVRCYRLSEIRGPVWYIHSPWFLIVAPKMYCQGGSCQIRTVVSRLQITYSNQLN